MAFQPHESSDLLLAQYRMWIDSGDETAWATFTALARRYITAGVWRAVRERGGREADAVDDLVQETFLKLFSEDRAALRRLNAAQPGVLVAYLRIAAHNVARDHFRLRSAAKRGRGEPTALEEHSAVALDLEEDVAHRLFLRRVDECLDRSAAEPRERAIFWLYFREGMTAKAIASVRGFDLTSKGAESALLRLVKRIRDCVAGKTRPLPSSMSGESPA